jgi:hypothetical protein
VSPADETTRLRIELSVITGARLGAGWSSLGVGALSFIDIRGWLLGFEGRADLYQPMDGTSPEPVLELALLGGRRFRFERTSVDLTAGLAAALQGTTTLARRSVTTGEMFSESGTSTVPRLLLGARLNLRARSVIRTFVGLDAEAGPPHASGLPVAPRLPLWTVGVALGATVGTP